MSKKSDSEYDSDCTTISGSNCSSSARSTQSSARSSYLSSTNYDSSSLRSSCIWLSPRKEERKQHEEQTLEACAAKEASTNASSDEDDILDKALLERITLDQTYINRRFYTAPLYGSKLLSSIPCALNKIDEKEEDCSTSCHSVHTSELTSKRSIWYSDEEIVERKVTPRQLEVPPKRICIRDVSPRIELSPKEDEEREVIPNKRFNFQNKSFILRHSKNTENAKSSVSTQICWDVTLGEDTDDSCTIQDISEAFASKKKKQQEKAKKKKEEKRPIDLPHCVSDSVHFENVPLEPNIVILDDESYSSDTSRRSSKGDAPNEHENRFMNCCPPKNVYSRPSRSIFSALERYFKSTSCEVSPFTPVIYHVSTDTPAHKKSYPTSSTSTSSKTHSEIRGRTQMSSTSFAQPRRKEPEHNFSTTFDMKRFKEVLGNFSEGVKPTRTFPIDFNDVDLADQANQEISFKEKGSQLICTAQSGQEGTEYHNTGQNTDQISRESPKSKLLVDVRRKQSTDVEFYYADGSGSSSESLRSQEGDTPVTDAREIIVDSDYKSRCCFCFRLKRPK